MELLLIHTGGTIGMAPGLAGLEPVTGLVENAVNDLMPPGSKLHTEVFSPLLDSADVGPSHWNRMLDLIEAYPETPVLITHGTDTMTFTGAALSLALAGSDRSVILCGSMVPLGMNGDAEQNLSRAVQEIRWTKPGVWLAFGDELLPANGLVKRDSAAANAFAAVELPAPLTPLRHRFDGRNIGVMTLTPGLSVKSLAAMLDSLDGAVLRIYGAGTAPSDPAIYDALTQAVAQGKRIRAVSQCTTGGLAPGAYAAGAKLWAAGVENGGNETPEVALVTLWLT